MSVLFIGTIISKQKENKLKKKGIIPDPSLNVQRYYLNGLSMFYKNITVISSVRIKTLISTKVFYVKDENFNVNNIIFKTKGFLNLIGVGFFERESKICLECIEWAVKHKNESNIIYVYSLHSPFLKAAYYVKKIAKSTKIVVIVPDLPIYMNGGGGKIRQCLKFIDKKRIDLYLSHADKYLLYTKYMADYLNVKKGNWLVVEGLINTSKIKNNTNENKFICIYAGSLLEKYGIRKMIRAFSKIKYPYKLHIYGNPNDAKIYKNDILKSKNVEFKGMVSSDDVFIKMREATLLINPRPSDLELTKYSCPSKTFEYMASGTPIVMCKLKGLPDEYFNYLYCFDEESEDKFVEKLNWILSKDYKELREKGRKAQCFLLNNKTTKIRFENIYKFVSK